MPKESKKMDKYSFEETEEAYKKAVRYYRRRTLGLIPVTIFMEKKIGVKTMEFLKENAQAVEDGK